MHRAYPPNFARIFGLALLVLTSPFTQAAEPPVSEVLRMATADNADPLRVDGDPIVDISLVADPAKNLVVIMKDGRI